MKRIFLSLLLFCSLSLYAQEKLAVYVRGEDQISSVLADRILDGIAQSGQFIAVERSAAFLSKIAAEQSFEQSGVVDDNEISRIGKQFGVQYVCVAAVTDIWKEKYLTARILNVENAEVLASYSVHEVIKSSQQLINAMNTLTSGLLNNLNHEKASNAPKVAVYVTRTGNREIDIILGDQLVAGFSKSNKYAAVERTNSFLAQISKEHNYQYNTGAVDDTELTRLGKFFGVKYVCITKTSKLFDDDYYISARLIDVEKAEVVNTYKKDGCTFYGVNDIVTVAQEIASHLSGRTFKEEDEYQQQARWRQEEAARQAQVAREEAERREKQALVNRNWRDLIQQVFVNVTQPYSNGNKYTGSYNSAGRQGYGAYRYVGGDMYFGDYLNNERSGYGTYITKYGYSISNCPNAMVYVGEWKEDNKHGTGTCYDADGKLVYYGKFMYDRPTGNYPSAGYESWRWEAVSYDNGDKYVGELLNGKRSGKGIYLWSNGDAWYGSWNDGERDGYGIYMDFLGTYDKGTWKGNLKQ